MLEGAIWTYLPGHLRLSTAAPTPLRYFCYSQPDNLTNLMANVPELSRHHLRMWNEMPVSSILRPALEFELLACRVLNFGDELPGREACDDLALLFKHGYAEVEALLVSSLRRFAVHGRPSDSDSD